MGTVLVDGAFPHDWLDDAMEVRIRKLFRRMSWMSVPLRLTGITPRLTADQGIPWKGRLNEDFVASVAGSVAELFDQLALDADPFDESSDEFARGKAMVERILQIEVDHPELAGEAEEDRKRQRLRLGNRHRWSRLFRPIVCEGIKSVAVGTSICCQPTRRESD
jgi:hypothetical protein